MTPLDPGCSHGPMPAAVSFGDLLDGRPTADMPLSTDQNAQRGDYEPDDAGDDHEELEARNRVEKEGRMTRKVYRPGACRAARSQRGDGIVCER